MSRLVDTPRCPVALTVAGSDSGGGAGIQADLAAFAYRNVYGTSAITAVTAQNPRAVADVAAIAPRSVRLQLEAVLSAFSVGAIKTGMLFSTEIISMVADVLGSCRGIPMVADPVMVATSGARLLQPDACVCLRERLLPLAVLVTPNLPEAEVLLGRPLHGLDDISSGARELARELTCAVLIKGGHGDGNAAVDLLCDGDRVWSFSGPRVVAAPTTHGTGCSLSASIAAGLAQQESLVDAIRFAKAYVLGRLRHAQLVGTDVWGLFPPAELPLDEIACNAFSADAMLRKTGIR